MKRHEPPWLAAINAQLAQASAAVPSEDWVYGYIRISQDESGRAEGVELQAKNLQRHAAKNRLTLRHIYCDNDRSGTDPNRPALRELLTLVESAPALVILARDVARLTRHLGLGVELHDLGKGHGVRYLFVKESECDLTTPNGRKTFMDRVNAAVEYVESNTENMLGRMKESAAQGKAQGGSRRFGYGVILDGAAGVRAEDIARYSVTRTGVLMDRNALRADEVKVLEEGRDRILNQETQTAICQDWNMRGITTAEGGKWRPGKLSKQLLLEAYVEYDLGEHKDPDTGERCECLNNPEGNGIRVHEPTGTRHRAQWPAIFTRTEHTAMAAAIRSHSRAKNPDAPQQRQGGYWLTGLVECGGQWPESTERAGQACDDKMIGAVLRRKRKDGTQNVQRRYKCRGRKGTGERTGCNRVYRDAVALETFVAEKVIAAYQDPEVLAWLDRGNDHTERIAELQREIDTAAGVLDAEVDAKVAAVGEDEWDTRVRDRTIAGLKSKVKALLKEQDSLRSDQAKAALRDISGDLGSKWDSKGERWKHETAARLIERVVVSPPGVYAGFWTDQGKTRHRFDPDAVDIIWKVETDL